MIYRIESESISFVVNFGNCNRVVFWVNLIVSLSSGVFGHLPMTEGSMMQTFTTKYVDGQIEG